MTNVLCVAIGSVAGGLARYYFGGFIQRLSGSSFPYGTMAVNLAGCFVIGFIAAIAGDRLPLSAPARVLLITGFCGAFTTFSAFMVETDFLFRSGHPGAAFLNILISLAAGFAVFRFGEFLGKF